MILQIPVQTDYNYVTKLQDMALTFAPKLLGAVLVYIIGSFIIRKSVNVMGSIMERKHYDRSLQSFLLSLVKVMLNILLILSGTVSFSVRFLISWETL